jgi:hypothetical protein
VSKTVYEQQDSAAWWLADRFKKDPHEPLWPHIQRLRSRQSGRYENMRRMNAAYENGPRNAENHSLDESSVRSKSLSFNHARNGIDTVHAKLIKSRILPTMAPQGLGPVGRRNAKDAEKAVHGEFKKNNFEAVLEDVIMDGLIDGIGWVHVLHGCETLTMEWVPADDVVVDEAETRQRMYRSIYRRYLMDRYVLLDKYGQKDPSFYGSIDNRVKKIRAAKSAFSDAERMDEMGNQIEVWAGWHGKSGPNSDDGRYSLIIDGATLEWDQWDRLTLPFAEFVPKPRRRQLNGIAMMSDFFIQQEEHDRVTDRIRESNKLHGGTSLLVPREANVDTRELTNGQARLIEYDVSAGGPGTIQELKPALANPQVFEYRKGLIDEMYQAAGVPLMAATGGIPAGMSGASGKAIQEAEEESAERLLVPHRARDRFVLKVANLVIEECAAIVDADSKYCVDYADEREGLQTIEWKKVLKHRDSFKLDIIPANALAKSHGARFAQLTELLKAGAIDVSTFRKLFGLPDIEAENDIDLSDQEIIDRTMDKIVIEGVAFVPEPFDNLQLTITRGRKFYNMCRIKEVPEERLALLRDYLARADAMLKEAMAPPPMPAAPAVPPPDPAAAGADMTLQPTGAGGGAPMM